MEKVYRLNLDLDAAPTLTIMPNILGDKNFLAIIDNTNILGPNASLDMDNNVYFETTKANGIEEYKKGLSRFCKLAHIDMSALLQNNIDEIIL